MSTGEFSCGCPWPGLATCSHFAGEPVPNPLGNTPPALVLRRNRDPNKPALALEVNGHPFHIDIYLYDALLPVLGGEPR